MKRIVARFVPQVWDGNGRPVDVHGRLAEWDATDHFGQQLPQFRNHFAKAMADGGVQVADTADRMKRDPKAPEWVREWNGPGRIVLDFSEGIAIGDVLVVAGNPPKENPYLARDEFSSVSRRAALAAFRDGSDPGLLAKLTFWYAPLSGGARRITDPAEINWGGIR